MNKKMSLQQNRSTAITVQWWVKSLHFSAKDIPSAVKGEFKVCANKGTLKILDSSQKYASNITLAPIFLNYRPQRSCGQGNIFTPVCHSVHRGGGGSASMHAGIPPPGPGRPPQTRQTTPQEQTPPRTRQTPLGADTPQEQTPREQTSPWEQTPPREADSSIRSTSGRYASYWNAFLFYNKRNNLKYFST